MIFFRAALFYTVLLAQIRLMGKRQLGQMEPSEFVVTILIANLASIPLENTDVPVWHGLVPMGLIFLGERTVTWLCLRRVRIRRLLCGKPVILIDNGRLIRENLRRTRINLDELSFRLREQGILEIETVQFAILETNGSVTVFPYPQFSPASARDAGLQARQRELPCTVISDGQLLSENLRLAGRDETWLDSFLRSRGCARRDVLLLTVTKSGKTALILQNGDRVH